jgi:dipeptidyl aminopeptidase/acylaminoacyl peptidase
VPGSPFPADAGDGRKGAWHTAVAYHPGLARQASLCRAEGEQPVIVLRDVRRQTARQLPFPEALPAESPDRTDQQPGGQRPRRRPPHEKLVFSPRGDRLAYFTSPNNRAQNENGDARPPHRLVVLDVESGARLLDREWDSAQTNANAWPMGSCDFSPDGRYLLVIIAGHPKPDDPDSFPFRCILWDVPAQKEALTFTLEGLPWFAFSADGALLATPDRDAIRVVRLPGGELVKRLAVAEAPGWEATHLAFSPDGKRLACATQPEARGGHCRLSLWDWEAGTTTWQSGGMLNPVRRLLFSPDGSRLLSEHESPATEGRLVLWDVRTARDVLSIPLKRALNRHQINFVDPDRIVVHEGGVNISHRPTVVGTEVVEIDGSPAEGAR